MMRYGNVCEFPTRCRCLRGFILYIFHLFRVCSSAVSFSWCFFVWRKLLFTDVSVFSGWISGWLAVHVCVCVLCVCVWAWLVITRINAYVRSRLYHSLGCAIRKIHRHGKNHNFAHTFICMRNTLEHLTYIRETHIPRPARATPIPKPCRIIHGLSNLHHSIFFALFSLSLPTHTAGSRSLIF